jgi:hypothetical protein
MLLTKETIKGLSVDEILELSSDQLALVTPFVPKPTGTYRYEITACSLEEYGESHAIKVTYKINECTGLLDDTAADTIGELPADYNELYFIGGDSDYGLRSFRTMFDGLNRAGEDALKTRELMEGCIGVTGECLLNFTKRKNKETGEVREGNQWECTANLMD